MSENQNQPLIIAIDYYDGEAEGFARIDNRYRYFTRLSVGETSGINQYSSTAIEHEFFDRIATLAEASRHKDLVFLYDGSNAALNDMLDEALPSLRKRLVASNMRSQGTSFLASIAGGGECKGS